MIYLFTWNNEYLIKWEALKWKKAFAEKHGQENITHISSLDQNTKHIISNTLISRSLFAEKRLVIIDGFPFSWEKKFSWASDLESMILEHLQAIPQEVLVVFLSANPDKRKTWYKTLSKLAEIKDFTIQWEDRVYHILSQKYWNSLEAFALKRLITLKWWDLQKCIWEIDKLLITKVRLEQPDVDAHIMPEFEESIFVFIDTLLLKNKTKIFSELDNLINYSNLYAVYQSIIANIRIFLYIELLKKQKKSPREIGDILKLWNRAFLINKQHKSSYKSISELYFNLLDFDKNMKFWKFTSSDEKDLKNELERIFLKFVS